MNEKRKIRLAKANGVEKNLQGDLINENIRKSYSQPEVEALICNVLKDVIEALENGGTLNVSSDHMTEFKKYLEFRDSTKSEQKEKFEE